MTFRDLIGKKDITIYTVSRSGSFSKKTEMQMYRTSIDSGFAIYHVAIENLDSNKTGLSENGGVSSSWGVAVFLDVNEAADLAEKIATTKYKNSLKTINKMRKDAQQ
jgi:hypothetical protein